MSQILSGKEVAYSISKALKNKVESLKLKGIFPTLAIVRVGEKAADLSYEKGAVKRCNDIGIKVKKITLPEETTTEQLLKVIYDINENKQIHGCLMFRPLPHQIDEQYVCNSLSAEKDIDSITEKSLNGVFVNRKVGFPPCTAQACLEILDYYGYSVQGKRVVVIGRSLVIGKPLAMMLLNRNATVTICHSKTENLPLVCSSADILIAAVGRSKMVNEKFVNPDQIVLDVGINVNQSGQLTGDVDFGEIENHVAAITPVPGGVGSVTTSVLCKHVIEAAENQI